MYELLKGLLSDRQGETVFRCFGIWHGVYMLVIFGAITAAVAVLRRKPKAVQLRAVKFFGDLAFWLYIADIFLMPFAYGQIDLEKLPFHVCTAMCVMCFISRRSAFWGRFRQSFAVLGLISNLVYVIYPAGVGWYQIHPLSYRVVQTLLFHGVMTAYGILALAFDDVELSRRAYGKDLLVTAGMVLWALLGNTFYNGVYDHDFNWFFVQRDPFYLLPERIAAYIMPFVTFGAFALVEGCVYGICKRIQKV